MKQTKSATFLTIDDIAGLSVLGIRHLIQMFSTGDMLEFVSLRDIAMSEHVPIETRLELIWRVTPFKQRRIYACWCIRQSWGLLVDQRSRDAIEWAELWCSGGDVSEFDLYKAWEDAQEAWDDAIESWSDRSVVEAAAIASFVVHPHDLDSLAESYIASSLAGVTTLDRLKHLLAVHGVSV